MVTIYAYTLITICWRVNSHFGRQKEYTRGTCLCNLNSLQCFLFPLPGVFLLETVASPVQMFPITSSFSLGTIEIYSRTFPGIGIINVIPHYVAIAVRIRSTIGTDADIT